jgi:hypothetical protein
MTITMIIMPINENNEDDSIFDNDAQKMLMMPMLNMKK